MSTPSDPSLKQVHEGRVLGIDYGAQRVGVALSDERLIFAQALVTVSRGRGGDRKVIEQLLTLIAEHDVKQIVIGWPLRLNGREGIQTQKVGRFIHQLEEYVTLPIHRWDERLTTTSASRSLRESGVRGARSRERIDQVAAAIILQSWLDAQSEKQVRLLPPE